MLWRGLCSRAGPLDSLQPSGSEHELASEPSVVVNHRHGHAQPPAQPSAAPTCSSTRIYSGAQHSGQQWSPWEQSRQTQGRRLAEVRGGDKGLGCSSAPSTWPRVLVVADEVAELTVRDLVDDRAARAAQQAAPGRLCGITRLGRSVHPPRWVLPETGCRGCAGADEGHLDGTVTFRVRAVVNSFILLDSDMAAMLPHRGRAVWVHETMEEFQAVDRSVEEGQGLRLARWGCRDFSPTTGPVSQWWQSTSRVQTSSRVHRYGRPQNSERRSGHAPMLRP